MTFNEEFSIAMETGVRVVSAILLFAIVTAFICLIIWQATQPAMPSWCADLTPDECAAKAEMRR